VDPGVAVLIAGNWKMFKGAREAGEFADAFAPPGGVDVVLCPPYVSLRAVVDRGLTTYAQNVHWAAEGAYTGEVSAPMLLELGVAGAIVGHSERRQYFGETDETVARRAVAAVAAGLALIACVGESEEERDAGQTELVLRVQVEAIADAVGSDERLVVAYEPIWAIGTGRTASPEQVQDAHAFIRSLLDVPLLYGGSVKPENAEELLAQPDVDGALVGGASLDVESFTSICRSAASIRS
jgi:triosephosphate isomerase (TIM)